MKEITSKNVRQIEEALEYIEFGLSEKVNFDRFQIYVEKAVMIAEYLESALNYVALVDKVREYQKRGNDCNRKSYFLKKIYTLLAGKVELLREKYNRENPSVKDELFYCYESKGFRNTSIERLEALKLQLELSKQKGFYLMQEDKKKIKAQEDILIVAAQIIQELSYKTDLVSQITLKMQGLRQFEDVSYVTETEEVIIASCYLVLFEALMDLNYR